MATFFYDLSQWATHIVESQLTHLSPLSLAIVFLAGLVTSLTPCMLSMLPIAISYIGGYTDNTRDPEPTPQIGDEPEPGRQLDQINLNPIDQKTDQINQTRPTLPRFPTIAWRSLIQSIWFALGLATTLAAMGIIAASLGRVYGQIGWGLPVLVSLVAIAMGLNLLEVLPLRFPSLDRLIPIPQTWPPSARSYLVGLTFGLAASPCSTPVLASLLAWVAATRDPILGGLLLLAYTAGYASPLVVAGAIAGSLKGLLALRSRSAWLVTGSGILLVSFGTISLLLRLPIDL